MLINLKFRLSGDNLVFCYSPFKTRNKSKFSSISTEIRIVFWRRYRPDMGLLLLQRGARPTGPRLWCQVRWLASDQRPFSVRQQGIFLLQSGKCFTLIFKRLRDYLDSSVFRSLSVCLSVYLKLELMDNLLKSLHKQEVTKKCF